MDSDGDGKIERWQTWVAGRVVSEELDTDGDGISDRRLRYGANGHLVGMDKLTREPRRRPRLSLFPPPSPLAENGARGRAYFQVSWFLRLSPLLAVTSTSATKLEASAGSTPGSSSSTTR